VKADVRAPRTTHRPQTTAYGHEAQVKAPEYRDQERRAEVLITNSHQHRPPYSGLAVSGELVGSRAKAGNRQRRRDLRVACRSPLRAGHRDRRTHGAVWLHLPRSPVPDTILNAGRACALNLKSTPRTNPVPLIITRHADEVSLVPPAVVTVTATVPAWFAGATA
jgi:hypothetical protein